mgnify:CR=1 FL=1
MSVLIRDMEMPKNCAECRFRQYEYCDMQRQDVYAVNIMDYALSLERHPDCPLIELPPHGRLIDADELANKTFYSATSAPYITYKKFMDAPTVIEAEGSETR